MCVKFGQSPPLTHEVVKSICSGLR